MVVEFLSQGGAGNDQRLTRLDASQDAGAPRGEAFVERVTERIDLVEQAKYAAFVRDKAGNDHVFGDAKLGGAGLEILLDIVDAADEGSDIDQGAPRTMTILLLDLPPPWRDARFQC